MQEADDITLLRDYAERNSEEAFATLVSRHINKVYSAALRHTSNPHQAEEITQAVFVILARKAPTLSPRVILSGWLYQTARLTAQTFIRSEIRRTRREQEAYMESHLNEDAPELWPRIVPLLDAAMARLNETDRHAVVLRFFDGKSMREISAALGATEDAVKMRLSRAMEKLQTFFLQRGVESTSAAIAETISVNSVKAAPAILAATTTTIALAKGATASSSTLAITKGALKVMAWTKLKTTAAISVAALVTVLGTTGIAIKAFGPFGTVSVEDVFKHLNSQRYLKQAPAVSLLRPTLYPNQGSWINGTQGRIAGRSRSIPWVLAAAYDIGPERMVLPADLPIGGFDYLLAAAGDPRTALQEALKKQFGLAAHKETRTTNVLVLKMTRPGAPGLKVNRSTADENSLLANPGDYQLKQQTLSGLGDALGGYYLNIPVIDDTGLPGRYDMNLRWNTHINDQERTGVISQMLQDQLGLELVPEQREIEMLVVEYQDGPSDYTPRVGSDLQGYWKGLEQMGNDHPWPVLLKITEPSDGNFRALWRRPWLNNQFIPASAVTYHEPKIKIEVAALPGVFEGEINSAHTEIKGTWTYNNSTPHPVTFKLTDWNTDREEAVAFNAQKDFSHADPNDAVGHWKMPNNDDIALDIARMPDGKLVCSMIRGGWDGTIDATLVQYTAPAVHLEWAWRGLATFDGKIENGKLTGTWQHGRKSAPEPIAFERRER